MQKLSKREVREQGLRQIGDCLRRNGWDPRPVRGGPRGVHLEAQQAGQIITIQVNALSGGNRTSLGEDFHGIAADFLIVCRNVATQPESFISTREEVNGLAVRRSNGQHYLNDFVDSRFCEKWEVLNKRV